MVNRISVHWMVALAAACFITAPPAANAFTVTITAGTRSLYLQVGVGTYAGTFSGGGTPGNNATINVVSVAVPAAVLGNGNDLAMTSNSAVSISFYDGYAFCNPPAEVYIGGFFRKPGTGGTAVLSASTPANLTTPSGSTVPFNQIRWTSSGNGDAGAQPIPAGTFVGGSSQSIGTFTANTWNESCHKFIYANDAVVGAGVYTGRVTYTLSTP